MSLIDTYNELNHRSDLPLRDMACGAAAAIGVASGLVAVVSYATGYGFLPGATTALVVSTSILGAVVCRGMPLWLSPAYARITDGIASTSDRIVTVSNRIVNIVQSIHHDWAAPAA